MGGGTQLLLGAHLTGANMRFCRESGKCRDHISYLSRVPRAVPVEKKSAMWRNFCTWHIVTWKRFSTWQNGTLKKFSTWEMWIQSVNWTNDVYNLWYFVALNCWKIRFLAIYAVLSRFFCCDLRAFVWRKIEPKMLSVEKKGQISGMLGPLF